MRTEQQPVIHKITPECFPKTEWHWAYVNSRWEYTMWPHEGTHWTDSDTRPTVTPEPEPKPEKSQPQPTGKRYSSVNELCVGIGVAQPSPELPAEVREAMRTNPKRPLGDGEGATTSECYFWDKGFEAGFLAAGSAPHPSADVEKVAEEIVNQLLGPRWGDANARSGIRSNILVPILRRLVVAKDAEIVRLQKQLLEQHWADKDRTEKAEAECDELKRYIDTQQRPSWERIQQALGGETRPFDENKSLCDEVVEAIAGRDALKAEVGRLKECLSAVNYGDVPKGWDKAIERAEAAERHVAALRDALTNLRPASIAFNEAQTQLAEAMIAENKDAIRHALIRFNDAEAVYRAAWHVANEAITATASKNQPETAQ